MPNSEQRSEMALNCFVESAVIADWGNWRERESEPVWPDPLSELLQEDSAKARRQRMQRRQVKNAGRHLTKETLVKGAGSHGVEA